MKNCAHMIFRTLKWLRLVLFLGSLFCLSGCFEIREEVSVSKEGAGSYTFVMDFSANRQLLQMLLDAGENEQINPFGAEGNPFHQVDSLFAAGADKLATTPGISQVFSIKDDRNFQYGLKFDFRDVGALNMALSEMQYSNTPKPVYQDYYLFERKRLKKTDKFNLRALVGQINPDKDAERLGEKLHKKMQQMYANIAYKHIIRFRRVKKFTNEAYQLSADKTTLTFSKTLEELQAGNIDIANEIKFK